MAKKVLIIVIIILIIIIAVVVYFNWFAIPNQPLIVTMTEINNSRQSGSATLIPEGEKTRIIINLANAPNYSQSVYIIEGYCARPGNAKYSLESLNKGRSESLLDLPFKEIIKQLPLAIGVYRPTQTEQINIACGNITTEDIVK